MDLVPPFEIGVGGGVNWCEIFLCCGEGGLKMACGGEGGGGEITPFHTISHSSHTGQFLGGIAIILSIF